MNGIRSEFSIIAALLRLEGAGVREVMDTAKLSYARLYHYLSLMMDGDFIVRSPGACQLIPYSVTSKGCELLSQIEVDAEAVHHL
jgi:predicted transcriptional regulator